ncbi:hypothetical protein D1632_17700 [Chryseobacterium nematophagum]|uniref:Uncharacterized protein n=1 Tax=Chryseobacterium nematophagum TaxID=2305228 RepID=A0A3M7L5Y3_9FLAO|nr:hypothetical protein D1632_17700 [Chryseobacterium nematophagum]
MFFYLLVELFFNYYVIFLTILFMFFFIELKLFLLNIDISNIGLVPILKYYKIKNDDKKFLNSKKI